MKDTRTAWGKEFDAKLEAWNEINSLKKELDETEDSLHESHMMILSKNAELETLKEQTELLCRTVLNEDDLPDSKRALKLGMLINQIRGVYSKPTGKG